MTKYILGFMILFTTCWANAQFTIQGPSSYNETWDQSTATSWSKRLTYKNTSSASATYTPSLSGTDASKFQISLNRCSTAKAPNALCDITIAVKSGTQKRVDPYLVNLDAVSISLTVTDSTNPPVLNQQGAAASAFDWSPSSVAILEFATGETTKVVRINAVNKGLTPANPDVSFDPVGTLGLTFLTNACDNPPSAVVLPTKNCSVQITVANPNTATTASRAVKVKADGVDKDVIVISARTTKICISNTDYSCTVPNASSVGSRLCAADGMSYGQCVISGCNANFYLNNNSCQAITYSPSQFSAYSPAIPTLNACDANVTSTRTITECRQDHDGAIVANNKCTDPNATVVTQSPSGNKIVSISHGSETYQCAAGSTVQSLFSRSCDAGYMDNGSSCQLVEYIATYTAYVPAVPVPNLSCDGTTTSQRQINDCKRNIDNAIVDNSLCSDPQPQIITESPAGQRTYPIANGSEIKSCLLGSATQTFVSRSCDQGYFDDGDSCEDSNGIVYTYTATYSPYSPAIPTLSACDANVISNRTIVECRRDTDNAIVDNALCSDPEPQKITNSPAGTKDSSILNGYETYFCAGGSQTQQYVSRTCDPDFHDDTFMCAPTQYLATYSSYDPAVPVGQVACDGTVVSNRLIETCRQQHDNVSVPINKCSDPEPQKISESPAGNKIVSISNGTETYSCALGSTTEVFSLRSCDSGYHDANNACEANTYVATYTAYDPAIPTLQACDGSVTSTRLIDTCRQSHDNTLVLNSFCSDATPSVTTSSLEGNRTFSIANGSEVRSCPAASTTQTFVSRTCIEGFFDDGDSCEDGALASYTPTFSDYSPLIPSNQQPCDGTVVSTRTIVSCIRDADGASVNIAFCSDPAPQYTSQSPAGTVNYSIANGSETYSCSTGSTAVTFVSRSCNPTYTNNGTACVLAETLLSNVSSLGYTQTPCAIGVNGKAYCWGLNTSSQMGTGTIDQSLVPLAAGTTEGAMSGKYFKSISSKEVVSCGIANDDQAYCWGASNGSGQLGNNSTSLAQGNVPVAVYTGGVLSGKTIKLIRVGINHSCVIASDDLLYCWGSNTSGALGIGTSSGISSVPVAVSTSGALSGKTIKDVVMGISHTCALASDDLIYCWGNGTFGQFGNSTNTVSNIPVAAGTTGAAAGKTYKSITAGQQYTCAIANDDLAYCWGQGRNGQLGNSSISNSLATVAVNTAGVLAGKTIKSIEAGNAHTCVIANDDKVYCWGQGNAGQLGNGASAQSTVPVAVTMTGALSGKTVKSIKHGNGNTTCSIASDNLSYCWGAGAAGQLGNNTSLLSNVPVAVNTAGVLSGKTMKVIATGNSHTCSIASDDKVYCWGQGSAGQFAFPAATNSNIPLAVNTISGAMAGKTVLQVAGAIGGTHVCAIASDNKAYCWGANSLGSSTVTSSSSPIEVDATGVLSGKTIKAITAGQNHACVIASDNKAYCWGSSNTYGQLGNNSTTTSLVPVAVDTSGVLSGKSLKSITAGSMHTCALATDNTAYCWGINPYGQLGNLGTSTSQIPVAVTTSGVLAGKSIKEIDAGFNHTCVIASDNKVYCFGIASSGEMGNGTNPQSHVTPVAVDMNGVLAGKTALSLSAGYFHTCIVASDNLTYCWGLGTNGQLGNGANNAAQTTPVQVTYTGALNNLNTVKVMAGSTGTCSLQSNGKVYCWGDNSLGQLGDGTNTNSNVPVSVAPITY